MYRFASRFVIFFETYLEQYESSWKDQSILLDFYFFTFKIDAEEFGKAD